MCVARLRLGHLEIEKRLYKLRIYSAMLSISKLPHRELIENRLREKTTDINNTVDILIILQALLKITIQTIVKVTSMQQAFEVDETVLSRGS